jgi:penicillin-binding protein 2
MTSCIANGGQYYKPRIVKQVVRQNGEVVVKDEPYLVRDLLQLGLSKKNLKTIHKGMFMSVNEAGGTASTAKIKDVIVAAKTGTAQTMDQGKKSNHSWMIAFAPYENPKYAICLMVENAGSGGKVCGPMMHEMFTGIFNQEKGEKLPLAPQTTYEGYLKRIEEVVLNHSVLENITEQSEEASGGLIEEEQVEIIDLPQKPIDQGVPLNEPE